MASRREARRVAVQAMYAYGQNPGPVDAILRDLPRAEDVGTLSGEPFVRQLCEAACKNIESIDSRLDGVLENWRAERLGVVDRAILRLATCELTLFDDIPSRVTLNEYIDLARELGDDPSPAFVNGVLDKMLTDGVASEESIDLSAGEDGGGGAETD